MRTFAPWGWTLGTGVYVDDVDREVRNIALVILVGMLLVSGLVFLLARALARRMSRPLQQLVTGLRTSDLSRRRRLRGQVGQAAQAFRYGGMRLLVALRLAARVASGSTELASSADEMAKAVAEIAR
ncbi:MAG: cache domain-containing protein [Holophagaceae bacterium]|nr:cache domain-containing protein [Holophagaceae bacterium]